MNYKFLHTCIRVLDLDKSIKFYEDALSFKETRRKDYPGDFCLVYLTDSEGAFELELTYNYGREEAYDMGNGYSHFAVEVEDLEKSREEHLAKGYQVTEIGGLESSETRFYFITDPDGYDIEIIQA